MIQMSHRNFNFIKKKLSISARMGRKSVLSRIFITTLENKHWPVITTHGYVEEENGVSKICHAVVMKNYTSQDSTLKLTVRDSLSGQKVFGEEVQSGEHVIDLQLKEINEGKLTTKPNQWNLGNEYCHYIELL